MASFINIDPLRKAATAAETEEEAHLCRLLANAICDGSPHAWKLFYSREAAKQLSKKSLEALEEVMQEAERKFGVPPFRSPLPRLAKTRSPTHKPAQGISIREPNSEKGKEKVQKTTPIGKGKEKMFEIPTPNTGNPVKKEKLQSGSPQIGSGSYKIHRKPADMYFEGSDGELHPAYPINYCSEDSDYVEWSTDEGFDDEDSDDEDRDDQDSDDMPCFLVWKKANLP